MWTVAWSPNDEYIAIGGNQGDLKLFNGKTFELLSSYPVEDVILSRLKWHPHQNKWIELEGLESSLRGLDWNHNGELLAVSEFEGEISIFDSTGKRLSRFLADPKTVAGIDWLLQKIF